MSCAPVAQLDRAPGYEPGGREFESLRAHQFNELNQCIGRGRLFLTGWLGKSDQQVAGLVPNFGRTSKPDLSNLTGVAKSSVRFDTNIPVPVAERLRELAYVANLIAEYLTATLGKLDFDLSL